MPFIIERTIASNSSSSAAVTTERASVAGEEALAKGLSLRMGEKGAWEEEGEERGGEGEKEEREGAVECFTKAAVKPYWVPKVLVGERDSTRF